MTSSPWEKLIFPLNFESPKLLSKRMEVNRSASGDMFKFHNIKTQRLKECAIYSWKKGFEILKITNEKRSILKRNEKIVNEKYRRTLYFEMTKYLEGQFWTETPWNMICLHRNMNTLQFLTNRGTFINFLIFFNPEPPSNINFFRKLKNKR